MPASSSPDPAALTGLEQVLRQFDRCWQTAPPPSIETFLPAGNGPGEVRRQLLEELVKLDLEYRWRRSAKLDAPAASDCAPLRLDDYVARFPELARPEPSLDLIGEEYRARHRWGDKPAHDDYTSRFAGRAAELQAVFRGIDAELASQYRGERGGVSAPLARSASEEQPLPSLALRANRAAHATPLAPMVPTSGADFLKAARRCQLLAPGQPPESMDADLAVRFPKPRDLGRELLQRGWLTAYQVNQLLQGRGDDLVVGPYVLLARLGSGGTGQVFKARHAPLDRLVALKLLHRELLADPEVLARFYREIRLISQLAHPHIIHAYDAGPIGRMQVLVMAYAPGIDLAQRVKQSGPLPIEQAIAYVCQTALGLQHLHERGLIHRDVKPSNLLIVDGGSASARELESALAEAQPLWNLTAAALAPELGRWGMVKVLDLGLARLEMIAYGLESGRPGRGGTTVARLTMDGAMVVGTPDYLAPEQAQDFHQADIRADVYSLGCTFWYMLTGQPPFPGGSLGQKLLRHQEAEPPPLEQFCPKAPPGLAAVVRRMLAKRPEERYQVPLEVVQALSELAAALRPRAARARRDRRLLILSGGLLALGLALFFSLLLLQGRNTTTPGDTSRDDAGLSQTHAGHTGEAPLLFADTFEGGAISPAWKFMRGKWELRDGTLRQTGLTEIHRKALLCDQSYPANVTLSARVRVDSWEDGGNSMAGIGLACEMGQGYGYTLIFYRQPGTIQFNDEFVTLGNAYQFPWVVGRWYHFKLQRDGDVLSGKVWPDGSPEPASWMFVQVGWANRLAGVPCLVGGSSAGPGTGNSTVSFSHVELRKVISRTRERR